MTLIARCVRRAGRNFEVSGLGPGATVGDLAKIAASLNAGLLATQLGMMHRHDAWTALEAVIRNFTGYVGPIDKRTRLKVVP